MIKKTVILQSKSNALKRVELYAIEQRNLCQNIINKNRFTAYCSMHQ
jgi:hypothetical protein